MEYASQFDVHLVHKLGKDYIIPDALSQLLTIRPHTDLDQTGELETTPHKNTIEWIPSPKVQLAIAYNVTIE